MKHEINPSETSRAQAFNLWMKSPMPMVTMTKTFDVTRIYKLSKQKGYKFNMLLCWCIGKAACDVKEFYTVPEQGKLYNYDHIAINVIVKDLKENLCYCDIAYSDDLQHFNTDYNTITQNTMQSGNNILDEDAAIIGTSAVTTTQIDSIVNQYSGIYCNPFLSWGKYRKRWFRVTLPISFQFHHTQMDGMHAGTFLENLQKEINELK
ncbi:MAG: chloramphenicol acetyltransferase [Bacteroidales bacterium]|nr:chloramphenicol acetyltransferase [Bacteroidales bacterium]